jgi:hypothetical protein
MKGILLSFLSFCCPDAFYSGSIPVTYVYRRVYFEVPVSAYYSHCVYLYAICQLKNKNIMLSYLDI